MSASFREYVRMQTGQKKGGGKWVIEWRFMRVQLSNRFVQPTTRHFFAFSLALHNVAWVGKENVTYPTGFHRKRFLIKLFSRILSLYFLPVAFGDFLDHLDDFVAITIHNRYGRNVSTSGTFAENSSHTV